MESAGLVGKRVIYTITGKRGKISEVREDGIIIVAFDNGETKMFKKEAFTLGSLKVIEIEEDIMEEDVFPIYDTRFLDISTVYNYKEVEQKFGIKICGFGSGAYLSKQSIVLVSVVKKDDNNYVYHDRWYANGDCKFSGQGKSGDQSMKNKVNSAIEKTKQDGRKIYLFVKFSPDEYFFQGEFNLVDYTYEDDEGEDGITRKEYKFRLRKVC